MADAASVIRAARWPDMPKACKLRSDAPEAAALARLRRLASQPASFAYHFGGNRPAAFTAPYDGPPPLPRMSELRHQARLFKLGYCPKNLTHHFGRWGGVCEIGRRVYGNKLDPARLEQRMRW
jgi:hypothetical protein